MNCGLILKQTYLLFLNVLREKRNSWKFTLLEILIPLYPTLLLFFIVSLDIVPFEISEISSVNYETPETLFNASIVGIGLFVTQNNSKLAFSPNTEQVSLAANYVCLNLGISCVDDVEFFDTQQDIVDLWEEEGYFAGISYGYNLNNNNEKILNGSITVHHQDLDLFKNFYNFNKTDKTLPDLNTEEVAIQFNSLLFLQQLATYGLIPSDENEKLLKFQQTLISLQKMPVLGESRIINTLNIMFALTFAGSFFMSLQALMTFLGNENERGIKLTLQLKGLTRIPYFTANLLASCLTTTIASTLSVGIIYASNLIQYQDFGLIYVVFLFLGYTQMSFGLLIVAIFGEKATGNNLFVTSLMLLIVLQGFFFVVQFFVIEPGLPEPVVNLFFLLFIIPFQHFMYEVSTAELKQTNDIFGLSKYAQSAVFFLIFDFFLYFILAILIDSIYEYRKLLELKKVIKDNDVYHKLDDDEKDAERKSGIYIEDLTKEFIIKEKKKKKLLTAVNKLNLTVKENQIFVILGHNGAGKSTFISLLSGNIIPTSGNAWINGLHIVEDRIELRKTLGVAPQFDIVYETIPCIQQLELFAGIAGFSDEEATKAATELLKELALYDKKDEIPKNLSGGQKRRLSLAAALIGKPKVVLLDEITTGLDVSVRKNVWRLLHKVKKYTTVILTTHSMEEADKLGDTIVVMSNGQKQAFGTSLELKLKYGKGYNLHCVRPSSEAREGDTDRILNLISKFVNGAIVKTDIGSELSFSLPIGEANKFPSLFDELEKINDDIISFGISPATLEDVFIELTELDLENKNKLNDNDNGNDISLKIEDKKDNKTKNLEVAEGVHTDLKNYVYEPFEEFECQVSKLQQIYAVLIWIVLRATRNPMSFMYCIFWPIMMVVIAGAINLSIKPPFPSPEVMDTNAVIKYSQAYKDSSYANENDYTGFVSNSGMQNLIHYYEPLISNAIPSDYGEILLGDYVGDNLGTTTQSQLNEYIKNNNNSYLTGIVKYDLLNDTSNQVILNILYNQTIEYSARSIVYEIHKNLLNLDNYEINYLPWQSKFSQNDFVAGGLMYFVATSFALLAPFYAEEIVRSRVSRIKDLLLLSGLPRLLYWFSNFLAHLILLLISFFCSYIVMIAFGFDGATKNNILAYLLLFISFGFANILFGYSLSFIISTIQQAQEGLADPINLTLLIPWAIVGFVLEEPNVDLENILSIFIPGFSLYRGLAILESSGKNEEPFVTVEDIFTWDKILIQVIVVNLCGAFIWFILILLKEIGMFRIQTYKRIFCNKGAGVVDVENGDDIDVLADDNLNLPRPVKAISEPLQKLIDNKEYESIPAFATNIRKTFRLNNGKDFHAVKKVNLSVGTGEILGLLGPNGAGKTTFLSCLTGVDGAKMDGGDAFIAGHSVVTDLENARKEMAICFQHDSLDKFLTGREHLRLFARIRGVPSKLREAVVDHYIKNLDLTVKANSRAGNYSGGNKRKLSVALSMLNSPSVVFLDEPSTGLDPGTRRFLWKFIESNKDKATILTTHSMEEADALSSSISIMIQGAVRAFGTSQQLKQNFGSVLSADIRIIPGDNVVKNIYNELINNVSKDIKLDEYELDDDNIKYLSTVRFLIPNENHLKLSSIFKSLNEIKNKNLIVEFTLSQTTLEDVFIGFAELQNDE